jgi:hypothetical protein
VLTVGIYLLVVAPVIRRPHLWIAGTLLALIPLVTWTVLDGTAVTAVTGLTAGAVFLAKGTTDLAPLDGDPAVHRRGREHVRRGGHPVGAAARRARARAAGHVGADVGRPGALYAAELDRVLTGLAHSRPGSQAICRSTSSSSVVTWPTTLKCAVA